MAMLNHNKVQLMIASSLFILSFGARTEQDLLYRDDFEALEQYFSHFSFCPVLSKPSESWFGQCGYVQDVLKAYLANQSEFTDIEFYLCGPAPMLLAVQRLLLTAGVMPSQIFKDDFTR